MVRTFIIISSCNLQAKDGNIKSRHASQKLPPRKTWTVRTRTLKSLEINELSIEENFEITFKDSDTETHQLSCEWLSFAIISCSACRCVPIASILAFIIFPKKKGLRKLKALDDCEGDEWLQFLVVRRPTAKETFSPLSVVSPTPTVAAVLNRVRFYSSLLLTLLGISFPDPGNCSETA